MTLSQWDLDNLSPEHQEQVKAYKDIWNSDPSQRESAHAAAEQIRAQYKYSGGSWGNQYNPFGADTMPVIPNIPEYESSYDDQLQEMFDQVKSQPQYESPYADLINKSISDIQNRPAHSYDPDNDPAYQAFLQRATRAGDKAYADNLGGLSAMTGGRANSWAGTVASQARNQYTLQAQEAVIQFEERSYSRYKDETTNMYNFVNLLQTQDQTSYNRYRDEIGDTKDLFNMVMQLDERDYGRWKDMSDQSWKVFDAESQQYRDALQEKKDKISEARDRTDMLGYVNNQDAITLGIPTGTLSQGARERAEKMEDYVTKQQHDLVQFRKEKEITHEFDLKLDAARAKLTASRSSGGGTGGSSGGGTGGSSSGGATQFKSADITKINSVVKEFNSLVNSKEFQRMSASQKQTAIRNFEDKIVNSVEKGLYGPNSMAVGQEIVHQMQSHPAYAPYAPKDPQKEAEFKAFYAKSMRPGFSPILDDFNKAIQKNKSK